MPELPEVETIARGLKHQVTGAVIKRLEVRKSKMVEGPPGIDVAKAIAGEPIAGVSRRGKYVVIALGSGKSLVVSLRMTGRLVVQRPPEADYPGTHAVLHLKDGRRISFADVRTFGRMRLVEPGETWDEKLGIEPLSSYFTPEGFIGMLSGRTTPVKALLLDQRHIAGIGNIYACEALWEAGICPGKPAKALSKASIRKLHRAIVETLERAVNMRGTSVDDYVDADGLKGGFQNVLSVYGRKDAPCRRCGSPIVRTVLGQRGTWWCRGCQR